MALMHSAMHAGGGFFLISAWQLQGWAAGWRPSRTYPGGAQANSRLGMCTRESLAMTLRQLILGMQGAGEPLLASDKKAAMLEDVISPTKCIARAASGERRLNSNLIKAIH